MHQVWERTCATSSATACFACRTRTNGRTAKPGVGQPQILGVRRGRKNHLQRWAHRTRITIRFVRWGGVQVYGAERDGDTRRGLENLGAQPPANRNACGTWGTKRRRRGSNAVHGGHVTAEGCTTHTFVPHA